ncbi:MAG: hypothetical protein Q4C68_08695 [Moraxella sp.]|nr:hypothetical protein [Moraxella sp.]
MKFIVMMLALTLLLACDSSPKMNQNTQAAQNTSAHTDAVVQPVKARPIKIDKQALTTIAPKPVADYPYAFDEDSQAVKNYAQAYNISSKQAQHAMTLAMASPEALGKVLDQIQGEYLGHSLTDGADMSLVIYTTRHVVSDRFDYVIADKFGEGLVLPVIITTKENASKAGLPSVPQVDINQLNSAHKSHQPQ